MGQSVEVRGLQEVQVWAAAWERRMEKRLIMRRGEGIAIGERTKNGNNDFSKEWLATTSQL